MIPPEPTGEQPQSYDAGSENPQAFETRVPEPQQTMEVPPVVEQAPPESPQDTADVAQIKDELEKAREQKAPGEETAATAAKAEEPKPVPEARPETNKCIICGSELKGDYCSVCDMHWETPT